MSALVYLVYYLIIFPLSLLPLGVLFLLSDALSFLLFSIIGYRKNVILKNLRNSFPEKSDAEIQALARKFQRHFTDIFFAEQLKSFSVSRSALMGRISVKNLALLQDLRAKEKSIVVVCGHYANWEYFSILPQYLNGLYPVKAIYKVQKNKVADSLIYKSRKKFGVELVTMEGVKQSFDADVNRPNIIVFIGDQSPSNAHTAYWTSFLNQETGVVWGTEKMSKIYDYAVVYADFTQTKRGSYELNFQLITEDAKSTTKGEITERHTKMLEATIRKQPAYWLWSHKRWKHKNPNKK